MGFNSLISRVSFILRCVSDRPFISKWSHFKLWPPDVTRSAIAEAEQLLVTALKCCVFLSWNVYFLVLPHANSCECYICDMWRLTWIRKRNKLSRVRSTDWKSSLSSMDVYQIHVYRKRSNCRRFKVRLLPFAARTLVDLHWGKLSE